MDLPSYWLRRPGPAPDAARRAAFDELLSAAVVAGPSQPIDYRLDAPLWQFLCHAADDGRFVLHGSGEEDIAIFEPRQSNDVQEFGARTAVYAAGDGIWPMYFAIVNRPVVTSMMNICLRFAPLDQPEAPWSEPYYFFSINSAAFDRGAFRTGTVYLLPADEFELQPEEIRAGHRARIAQLASPTAVRPAAKVTVTPEDFPFLDDIRGHDEAVVWPQAVANPLGFPWLEEG